MSKRVGELSNCPFETLCLWGSDDEILDKSYPKKLQALAPTIKLKMVPRCGHTPHLEASEIVAKEVLEFVRA